LETPIPAEPSPSTISLAPKISRGEPDFLRVTAALFFGALSTFALLYSVQPLLPVFARVFDVSPAVSSLSLSAATGVLAVAMIAAGAISDRVGRKRIMVAALAASSAATLLAAFSRDWTLKQTCGDWPTGKFDDSVSGRDSEALSCQANLLWSPAPSSVRG
jgi:YNFM family putative membrane transporter